MIADLRQVAHLLAIRARRILEHIEERGDTRTLLRPLALSPESGLGITLDEEFFASTIVQTLVYALFAAWLDCADPEMFTWTGTEHDLRFPVMSTLLDQVEDPQFVRECNLRPQLDDIVSVLALVNRDDFVARFDERAIEYFYEPFLAEFDSSLRDRLGVWYTPHEIADHMVARVDHHLREDLGIPAGLADESVTVLDPACGTGTYLAAIYRVETSWTSGTRQRNALANEACAIRTQRVGKRQSKKIGKPQVARHIRLSGRTPTIRIA